MTIRVENPPGYDAEAMTRKYIMAVYQMNPADFISKLEEDARESESR